MVTVRTEGRSPHFARCSRPLPGGSERQAWMRSLLASMRQRYGSRSLLLGAKYIRRHRVSPSKSGRLVAPPLRYRTYVLTPSDPTSILDASRQSGPAGSRGCRGNGRGHCDAYSGDARSPMSSKPLEGNPPEARSSDRRPFEAYCGGHRIIAICAARYINGREGGLNAWSLSNC